MIKEKKSPVIQATESSSKKALKAAIAPIEHASHTSKNE